MFGLFKKKTKSTIDSTNLQLTIKEVVKETKDAVSVVFEEPASGAIQYQPGQYLTLISTIDGKKIRRAYSLSSSSAYNESPTVTIKRVEGGRMSNHVSDTFKAGDTIEVMAPMGSFVIEIKPEGKKHLFLFGGGSGITPLMSIAKTTLKLEPNSKVTLLYANRDEESIIFKSKLEALKAEHGDRLQVIHCLETASTDWNGYSGYLTKDIIKEVLDQSQDEQYTNIQYMTCGPEPMMNIVLESLEGLNIPQEIIHKESFTPASATEVVIDDSADKLVTINLDGESHQVMVPNSKSILEAGLDDGIDMPYSCQSGLCTACRGKLVKGEIDKGNADGLTDSEKEEGYVLLCVSHAKSNDIEVTIG
ncbi:ferredoxin--NADP reductase [Reichenbachiella agariperforans]|uniref:ferredoxin--NADP reductase n=1 Tax=Reichenbachiella agariperforans TaxID=156994 RepID=UPI001C0A565B|nr:ferredoxin--NADP reductase [Reichenbachiella agariperforans]MBU2914298.1 ferredoxin--NADP reductase [Reichenbachiella agariperforans]